MGRPKKSKEAILARRRLAKRKRYASLKENEELYAAEKEKERQRYMRRKEEKKILGINDLTPRAQREKRRKWKINSKKYLERKAEQKKIQVVEVDAEEPAQEKEERSIDPLINTESSTSNVKGTHITNIDEQAKISETELIFKLRAQVRKLRYERNKEGQRLKNIINSIKMENKKLRRILLKTQSKISKCSQSKLRKSIKLLEKQKNRKQIKNKNIHARKLIENFFDDDENTWHTSGRKEFVSRNKIKRQKRYLKDTLKNLYQKFIKESGGMSISYSFFCRCRPFWVCFPKNNRNTCQCIYHCNMELLIKSLHKSKIVNIKSNRDLLITICCDTYSENCLDRKCEKCKNKTVEYLEFSNDDDIFYYEWSKSSDRYVKDGIENKKNIWSKKEIQAKPLDLIQKFEKSLDKFLQHCANILVQSKSLKELKANLLNNEALIHLDFSENYSLKHHEEIQSFHFGGSRQQVSIHTVIVYIKCYLTSDVKAHSICTLSDDLRHNALSIWAHIEPVLKFISESSPFIDTLHFYSDSPSSQYRNRHIFYIASQLDQQFLALRKLTWNFLEVGHGKGAPDGLGAVIKRNADRLVKSGTDVGTFNKFVEVTKANTSSINIVVIKTSDITAKEQIYPNHVPGFRGTMNVHQILWAIEDSKQLEMRRRSCFKCLGPCVHYHLGYHNLENVVIPAITLPSNEEFRTQSMPNIDCAEEQSNIEPVYQQLENVVVPAHTVTQNEEVWPLPDIDKRRFSPELVPKRQKKLSVSSPVKQTKKKISSSKVLRPVDCNVEVNFSGSQIQADNLPAITTENIRKRLPVVENSLEKQQEVSMSRKRRIQETISKMTKQEGKINTILLSKPQSVVSLSSIPKRGNWQNSTFIGEQSKSYSDQFQLFVAYLNQETPIGEENQVEPDSDNIKSNEEIIVSNEAPSGSGQEKIRVKKETKKCMSVKGKGKGKKNKKGL